MKKKDDPEKNERYRLRQICSAWKNKQKLPTSVNKIKGRVQDYAQLTEQ